MSLVECIHKKCAERQRKQELERYGNDDSCRGYYEAGCFNCDGLNTECSKYSPTRV